MKFVPEDLLRTHDGHETWFGWWEADDGTQTRATGTRFKKADTGGFWPRGYLVTDDEMVVEYVRGVIGKTDTDHAAVIRALQKLITAGLLK